MAPMSGIDECPSETFCDSSHLTNWALYYGATCHMTPEVLDSITGSLYDTDKHIEVADVHHITEKEKVQVQIQV